MNTELTHETTSPLQPDTQDATVNTQHTQTPSFKDFGRQFVILTKDKKPTHHFTEEKDRHTFDEVKEFQNVGLVLPPNVCVIDFDRSYDASTAVRIANGLNLKTWIMWSNRGIHLWFKIPEGAALKNAIKQRLAVGLFADRKLGSRCSFVVIKQFNEWRKWQLNCSFDEIEPLPPMFMFVDTTAQKFNFAAKQKGEGRNDGLFSYIPVLQKKEFEKDDIIQTLQVINQYVFRQPLSDEEMSTICRDEAFETKQPDPPETDTKSQKKIEDDGTEFKFYIFGDTLIEKLHIIYYHNDFYIYDNGYYKTAGARIEKSILQDMKLNQHQRAEVLSYMRIQSTIEDDEYEPEPYIITAQNVRINLETGETIPFSPNFLEFSKLPVTYDPNAQCADVDRLLNNVFQGREKLIDLFIEFLGAIIIKNTDLQKAALFVGGGANGKSTILKMIQHFLGRNNYSTIPLEKLGDRFLTAELDNKLANIGDDISCTEPIIETSVMKKLITGDEVSAERKCQKPFTMKPYATHLYSCNGIPRSFDKSEGFYRRWTIIPFDATFTPRSPDFDPYIEKKVTTPEAMSYLLNLAIKGAKKIIADGEMSEPEEVQAMKQSYRASNSTVLQWIDDEGLEKAFFMKHPMNEYYSLYTQWCKDSGIYQTRVVTKIAFNEEIRLEFGFDKKPMQRSSDGKRFFRIKL